MPEPVRAISKENQTTCRKGAVSSLSTLERSGKLNLLRGCSRGSASVTDGGLKVVQSFSEAASERTESNQEIESKSALGSLQITGRGDHLTYWPQTDVAVQRQLATAHPGTPVEMPIGN